MHKTISLSSLERYSYSGINSNQLETSRADSPQHQLLHKGGPKNNPFDVLQFLRITE